MEIKTKNICIFGDSIAYGAWDGQGGWVDRLRQFLHDRTLASRFTEYYFAYHLGIPGDTTADVLRRLPMEAGAREPHVIIFAIGINDARYRDANKTPHVLLSLFAENVKTLIVEARSHAREIIFLGLTPVDETKTMPFEENIYFENANIAIYNETIKRACEQEKVQFVDMTRVLDAAHDLEDGLHPNEQGHKKIFEQVKECLERTGGMPYMQFEHKRSMRYGCDVPT